MAQPLPHFIDFKDCNVFITQTVSPTMYHMVSREIFKQTKSKFEEALKRHCKKYWAVMELTKQAIPHYHAIVIWKDNDIDPIAYQDTIKSFKLKCFGHNVTKPVTDLVELCDYMVKDLKNTKTHRIINNGKKSVLPIYFSSNDTRPKLTFNLKDSMINSMKLNGNSCNVDSGLEELEEHLHGPYTEDDLINKIFINVKK